VDLDLADIFYLAAGFCAGRLLVLLIWARMNEMDRLKEKLKQASGVVARAAQKIENEADSLIAREAELDAKTKSAFAPHHIFLNDQKKDLDQLEDALQIVSNSPLPASGAGYTPVVPYDDPQALQQWLQNNKITLEQHNAAIAHGEKPESRYYFEFIEKMKANAGAST
jgi:hypothetical protein